MLQHSAFWFASQSHLGAGLACGLSVLILLLAAKPSSAIAIDPEVTFEVQRSARLHGPAALTAQQSPLPPRSLAVYEREGREWIRLWLLGSLTRESIEKLGGRVNFDRDNIKTADVPVDAVSQLLELSGLDQVQAAQPVDLMTDVSISEVEADFLWGGAPPSYPAGGVTGKNVVICIVDTGIDVLHPDFRTPAGHTRLLYLWDQNQEPPVTYNPPGFTYGSEYTAAAINSGQYTQGDHDGHGTLVAGVAAGNGSGTGNGLPPYRYVGVAPRADLIVVRVKNQANQILDSDVINGVQYAYFKAAQQGGKQVVVLLSSGKISGTHDGRDPYDRAVSSLTGVGKAVVAAAGNYGGQGRHAEWTGAMNQTGQVTLSVPALPPLPTGGDYIRIEGWHHLSADFDVSVVTPQGLEVGPVLRDSVLIVATPSGSVQISNGIYQNLTGSAWDASQVLVQIYRQTTAHPPIQPGIWALRFRARSSGTSRIDLWSTSFQPRSADYLANVRFVQGMTETQLVCSPATGDSVVSVGAYSTKNAWTGAGGEAFGEPSAALNNLASFSSRGPRRDGKLLPDIAAPGFEIAAPLSGQTSFLPYKYYLPDGVHRIGLSPGYGTSLAAAHGAGVMALLLEQAPQRSPSFTRLKIHEFAKTDVYTGTVPNFTWGYGKLNAAGFGPVGVSPRGEHAELALRAQPSPARGETTFDLRVPPENSDQALSSAAVRIFDTLGRAVAVLRTSGGRGTSRVVWDGLDFGGRLVPAGVYLARMEVGGRTARCKFVRMR